MQRDKIHEYEKREKGSKREIGGNEDESGEIPGIWRAGSSAIRIAGGRRAGRWRGACEHRSNRPQPRWLAHIVDGKMWMLFLGQMREGIGCADAGIDGQGKRTATMRHRNFQRGVDAHHSEFLCSNAKLPGRAAQCFERWFAYDVNARTGEVFNHRGDRAGSAECLSWSDSKIERLRTTVYLRAVPGDVARRFERAHGELAEPANQHRVRIRLYLPGTSASWEGRVKLRAFAVSALWFSPQYELRLFRRR